MRLSEKYIQEAALNNVLFEVNTGAISTSFPFTSADLTQDRGILYGINMHNNGLVIFDRFSLENANMVVFAKSGAGKSFTVKLEALRGVKKEFLEAKTRKELRVIATELQITGRWEMNKEQLIDAILRAESAEAGEEKNVVDENLQSAKDECKIDNHEYVEVEDKVENESAGVKINMEQKMSYIENIDIGAIVAFRLSNGKVKSAKVTRKSTKNRKLKLETDYGAEYIVPYESVIWVRTGKRWPRGVYNLLKGAVCSNVEKEQGA